jgi:hypothetical protein
MFQDGGRGAIRLPRPRSEKFCFVEVVFAVRMENGFDTRDGGCRVPVGPSRGIKQWSMTMKRLLSSGLAVLAGAKSIKTAALTLAVIAAACLGAATGHAATARTWVANNGSDSNPCSVTQPCLTFAGALANTSSGGEINCLTPGGFGGASGVTISISVTIDCEAASNGGITGSGVNNAITINTAGIVVNLIGLDINGSGTSSGAIGVSITAPATVTVRNCKIYGFQSGGSAAAIELQANASGGTLVADNVFLSNNFYGIVENSISGTANMTVRNSNISNNSGVGISLTLNGGTHAGATIEQTTLAFNGEGLAVDHTGAIALIGGSTVVNNTTGVFTEFGGAVYSFGNNQIGGNSTDGTPLTAYPGGPLN